jgi:hypothetical protein
MTVASAVAHPEPVEGLPEPVEGCDRIDTSLAPSFSHALPLQGGKPCAPAFYRRTTAQNGKYFWGSGLLFPEPVEGWGRFVVLLAVSEQIALSAEDGLRVMTIMG